MKFNVLSVSENVVFIVILPFWERPRRVQVRVYVFDYFSNMAI